ncbi:MAG: hypothetical protein FWE90_00895 [Defluviitaleaceae bacterium]|nr:hypothetical protein [Defluviitaleaceae bacterium]
MPPTQQMQNDHSVYGGFFCSSDERQIASIGTGYLANYVSGGGGKSAGATLTNRRVYFSGNVFARNANGRFVSVSRRQIVNTRDITGTGYDFYKPLYLIFWAVLSVIASVIGFSVGYTNDDGFMFLGFLGIIFFTVFIIRYFIKRKTLFSIEYAGGNIAFDVQWIQKHEQDDFVRNIHLAKDKLFSTAAADQGYTQTMNTTADQVYEQAVSTVAEAVPPVACPHCGVNTDQNSGKRYCIGCGGKLGG